MTAVSQINNNSTRQSTFSDTGLNIQVTVFCAHEHIFHKQAVERVKADLLPSKTQPHPFCLVELCMMVTCSCTFPLPCCNCIGLELVHPLHLCKIYLNMITTHYHFWSQARFSTLSTAINLLQYQLWKLFRIKKNVKKLNLLVFICSIQYTIPGLVSSVSVIDMQWQCQGHDKMFPGTNSKANSA